MFPALTKSKQVPVKKRPIKEIWSPDAPPQNIDQIYTAIQARLNDIKKDLGNIEAENCFDEENLFDTLNFYIDHIQNIKELCGVGEIRSLKTIKEITKVVKLNIKHLNKQELKELLEEEEEQRLSELEKSFVSYGGEKSPLKLPLIASKTNLAVSEKGVETLASNEVLTEVVVKKIEAVEDEVSDEEPEVNHIRKKKSDTKKMIIEFPVDLQNNIDSFISPILREARIKNTLDVDEACVEDLEILEEHTQKLCHAINEKFIIIMNEINSLCDIYDKYLLSFLFSTVENFTSPKINNDNYQIDKNFRFQDNRIEILLNTSIKYDNKRLFYKDFVKSSLKDLKMIQTNFDDGTYNGIDLDDFTPETRKLCERFDAQTVPFLFIIPEYSLILNKCVKVLNEWLQYDKDYIGFIEEDLRILEKRKKNMQSVRHNQKQVFNQLSYRIKNTKLNTETIIKHFKEAFQKTSDKLRWSLDFEEKNQVVLNFQRELTKKKNLIVSRYITMDCNQMLEECTKDLDYIEACLTQFKANVGKIKPKKVLYEEKQAEIERLEQNLLDVEYQSEHFFEQKKINPNELIILENCYLKLKEIHMYKKSCDTLRKIHYDLPLTSLKFGLTDSQYIELMKMESDPGEINASMPIITKHDQLFIAMHIISSLLENDWIKFYYTLPFNPERGMENIKKDVDDANLRFNRGDVSKERSLYCLQKWKRIHLRARLDDLRSSLDKISRQDILAELNRRLGSFDGLVMRKNEIQGSSKQEQKMKILLSSQDLESKQRKIEAEILHNKLTNFFERKKNNIEPKTYKFHSHKIK